MEDHWVAVCLWASSLYLLLIFGGQHLMADRQHIRDTGARVNARCCREPFHLRRPLMAWNLVLAVFSILGAARTLPEFIFTFRTHGIYHSLCVPR